MPWAKILKNTCIWFSDGGHQRVQRDEGVPEDVPQEVRRRGQSRHPRGHPRVLPEYEIGQTSETWNPEILSLNRNEKLTITMKSLIDVARYISKKSEFKNYKHEIADSVAI